jgi:hypothetical protein
MIARSIRFVLLVLVALCACKGKPVATFFPESARVGESLRIQIASANLDSSQHLRVMIAGQSAPVVRVLASDLLEVIVPRIIAQADAPVVIFSDNGEVGTGILQVLDAAARRLVFTVDENAFSIVGDSPSGDAPTGHVLDSGRRLSIDVVTAQGALIHSATILDPSHSPMERFVPTENFQGIAHAGLRDVPGPKAFAVTIPKAEEPVSILVYDVPVGVDVLTEKGRDMRSLLATLEVDN